MRLRSSAFAGVRSSTLHVRFLSCSMTSRPFWKGLSTQRCIFGDNDPFKEDFRKGTVVTFTVHTRWFIEKVKMDVDDWIISCRLHFHSPVMIKRVLSGGGMTIVVGGSFLMTMNRMWLFSECQFSGHEMVDSVARHIHGCHRRSVFNGKGRIVYSNTFIWAHQLGLSVALLAATVDDLNAELE